MAAVDTLNIESGWFESARHLPSSNADERPPEEQVELIVVHAISLPPGEFGGGHVEKFFRNRLDPKAHPYFSEISAMRVSAHLYIDRQGQLTQFVSTRARAWHCGVSAFEGRQRCNDFSVGIEMEGCDNLKFAAAQYERLVSVLKELVRCYPLCNENRIVGHSDIAPGRKTDPGPHFDWDAVRNRLAGVAAIDAPRKQS